MYQSNTNKTDWDLLYFPNEPWVQEFHNFIYFLRLVQNIQVPNHILLLHYVKSDDRFSKQKA